MLKDGKRGMVLRLKTWQKIISAVLVVVLIGAAVWYFSQEQKDCCLCSSVRYHAPCLIDLETGKMIELDIPTESITNPSLCKSCRKQLDGLVVSRYVLADLYSGEAKNIIPIKDDLTLDLRCYHITAQQEKDVLKLIIQGTME